MVERGVILAGGNGTRLRSISDGRNKHMVKVANRPMIEYPLQTLREMGVENATIVSSPIGVEEIGDHVKDGSKFGLDVEYAVQPEADGMAGALGCAAVKESVFVVLCGDCYYDPTPKLDGHVQLWWTEVPFARNHGVWSPETNRIVEKPLRDIGLRAVIGAYVYDQQVFEFIKALKPSARGELEITDLNNRYLEQELEMSYYGGFFGDMGTPQGLHRVEAYERRRCEN